MRTEGRLPQVRITVNSRCGRACFFCRPSGEGLPTARDAQLDVATIHQVCDVLREFGIRDVKLTGGDPALWSPLVECVQMLKRDLSMRVEVISRHPRIGDVAQDLADAGVDVLNMSIDSLRPKVHHEITAVDDLQDVLAALTRCIATGVPCKVNTVVMHGVNDDELAGIVDFCEASGVHTLKFLDVIQDIDGGAETFAARLLRLRNAKVADLYQPLTTLARDLARRASSTSMSFQGGLGHPMTKLTLKSGLTVLLKDHHAGAWYGSVCDGCRFYPCHDALMALRLTADRRLQFCLLRDDATIDLKPLLHNRASLRAAVDTALDVYAGAEFHQQEALV